MKTWKLKSEAKVLKLLNLLAFEGAGISYAIKMYIQYNIHVAVFDKDTNIISDNLSG